MLDLPNFMFRQAQCGAGASKQSRGMLTEETFICSSLDINYKKKKKKPSLLQSICGKFSAYIKF